MAKTLKNYRLDNDIIKKLDELQNVSGKTATDLVSVIINYVSEEYTRAIKGREHDAYMLAQVLGKRIEKVS